MKTLRYILIASLLCAVALPEAAAQKSTSTTVTRRSADAPASRRTKKAAPQLPATAASSSALDDTDAELAWMKIVYRSLDLDKTPNATLYYPEEGAPGEENLFRLLMRLLASNSISAYEYLDARESFDDSHKLNVRDMLDRFHIYYSEAKGHSGKNPVFDIDPSDVPAAEVTSYYIIERYEFDRRQGRMRTHVLAICPVLNRTEEFGQEPVKYPMFWVRYSDIRPWLTNAPALTGDDNNLATATLDDYFTLGMYEGEIYKTRNLRNRSMAQLFPDPEARKQACDSIERRIDRFGKDLWVPTLEDLEARRAAVQPDDSTEVKPAKSKRDRSRVASRRPARKSRAVKASKSSGRSAATRSVRDRKTR